MAGLQMKTRGNGDVILQEDTIRKFKESLRGELILSQDVGYDDARSVWNAMIDRRPALIARCLGVADVATCINFARESNLLLSIKGGGHNISGLAACERGLMLDMSRMRGIWLDPTLRTARAQAGCLLGDVDRRDSSPRTCCRTRLRLSYRNSRPHTRRRIRLPHTPVRLDER